MRVMVISVVVCALGMVLEGFEKKTVGIGNQRNNWDHTDHSIVKISKKTLKNLRELRRPTVTQTPVKADQLTFEWKTDKECGELFGGALWGWVEVVDCI